MGKNTSLNTKNNHMVSFGMIKLSEQKIAKYVKVNKTVVLMAIKYLFHLFSFKNP